MDPGRVDPSPPHPVPAGAPSSPKTDVPSLARSAFLFVRNPTPSSLQGRVSHVPTETSAPSTVHLHTLLAPGFLSAYPACSKESILTIHDLILSHADEKTLEQYRSALTGCRSLEELLYWQTTAMVPAITKTCSHLLRDRGFSKSSHLSSKTLQELLVVLNHPTSPIDAYRLLSEILNDKRVKLQFSLEDVP